MVAILVVLAVVVVVAIVVVVIVIVVVELVCALEPLLTSFVLHFEVVEPRRHVHRRHVDF